VFGVFLASSVAALWYRHDRAILVAERRADNLALILSEHFRRSVDAIDATLTQLALHSQRVGGARAPAELWTPVLATAFSGLPGLGSLTVVDEAGTITAATIPVLVGQSPRLLPLQAARERSSERTGRGQAVQGRDRRSHVDPARTPADFDRWQV
jgi:hypothetical protein